MYKGKKIGVVVPALNEEVLIEPHWPSIHMVTAFYCVEVLMNGERGVQMDDGGRRRTASIPEGGDQRAQKIG